MEDYYSAQPNDNGIYRVTATSAQEFSLEKNDLRSGLFTFSLLNALKDKKVDVNNDRQISVSEIYQYVSAEVPKLSNGLQNPFASFPDTTDVNIFRLSENNDFRSPSIVLIEPESKSRSLRVTETSKNEVKIKGLLVDESPIKYLLINGEKIALTDNRFEVNRLLHDGENLFSIVTEDIHGNQSTQELTIIAKDQNRKQYGTYHAIIIGVEKYQDPTLQLDRPVADAKRLRDILTSKYTFDSSHVTLLENPTRKEMYDVFTKASRLEENDNLLIFYAGHGEMRKEEDQAYWLPSDAVKGDDASWFSLETLIGKIKAIKANHILLITDACFSGKLLFKSRSATDSIAASVIEVNKMKSRQAITSGAATTVPDKSVFLELLCDYLNTNKQPYLFSRKIYSSIVQDVINRSPGNQTPIEKALDGTGDQNGDFIFIKK